jgi:hypothetical protein
VRQLLTESVLLSLIGGVLGTLIAVWGAHIILALLASGSTRPLGFDASVDTRVLLFTAGIALLTGIVFGLAPAMRSTRVDLTPALKDGGNSTGGARRARNRSFNIGNSLVVGQIALAMIVLVGAGLLVRLRYQQRAELQYQPHAHRIQRGAGRRTLSRAPRPSQRGSRSDVG